MSIRKITEGAIVLAIYTIMLLILLYVPIIGTIMLLVLPVPFIYYTAKNNWKDGFVFFVASLAITFIVGSVLSLPMTISLGLTGLVFGWCIHTKRDRFTSFIAGTITFLIILIIQYVISIAIFNINYLDEFTLTINETIKHATSMMEVLGQDLPADFEKQIGATIDLFIVLLPSMFVLSSALIVLFLQIISYPIIKRLGIQIPASKPFRELSLPRSIIWYFLIVLILSLIIPAQEGTFLYNAITNLVYIMQMLFVFQGITFIFYFAYQKNVHKAVPVIVTIFALLNPLLVQIVRILGIIDVGFGLRNRLTSKKNK
ncbi:YybS family protein [Caldibacillus lycopersici]|uniref:YybS family protein n=1 Tax=Perspicuibacillus lycopersici TaxID=1325689 RepID=A0AAE3LT41_9BACI|nr:YybS family protein [Perspicuibacillus lycopersici]MCU9613468.1 YybS family protein [Perspicuibacillus lycopersici]